MYNIEKQMNKYFVSGIGTGIGKTVASAILSQAMHAGYWKPIQSGDLDDTDSMKIANWTNGVKVFPERYRLEFPASPHQSSKMENITISVKDCIVPETDRTLFIEGAGGLMVPLNDTEMMIDLIKVLQTPVILCSMYYLGAINHTLLSYEVLQKYNIPIAGIVFIGEENSDSKSFILKHTKIPVIAEVSFSEHINKDFILEQSKNVYVDLL